MVTGLPSAMPWSSWKALSISRFWPGGIGSAALATVIASRGVELVHGAVADRRDAVHPFAHRRRGVQDVGHRRHLRLRVYQSG